MKNTRAYVININLILIYVLIFLFAGGMIFICRAEEVHLKMISSVSGYMRRTEHIPEYFPLFKRDIGIKKISANFANPIELIRKNFPFVGSVSEKLSDSYGFNEESNGNIPSREKQKTEVLKNDIVYNPAITTTIKSVNSSGGNLGKAGITLNNKSGYSPDLLNLYNSKLKIKKEQGKPQILIVHTHGTESYNPTDRNEDKDKNVVRIGREMAEIFKKNGIEVIHSEKMHDIPKFNNSYNNSLSTINHIISENPSISIVLDIHRDAMIKESGETYKVVREIDGKSAAQVMFVVGTNKSGLSHDSWQENLKFAIKCQEKINSLYPDLARPIDLREERFNQHVTNGSLIIEVGTNGNTLEEAIISAKITAEAISSVIK